MLKLNRIYNADCIGPQGMCLIPDQSIDMILADPPYGTTECKWDSIIPLEPMWEQLKRVIKPHGAIVITASQPFTSALVWSHIKGYKHHWIWKKTRGTGFHVAKYRPMMQTEDIIAFTRKGERTNYYPQKTKLDKPVKYPNATTTNGTNHIAYFTKGSKIVSANYPLNIIEVKQQSKPIHPTQKPVPLFEYLIKTYTNEGDLVLDFVIGSGTTAIACQNLRRNFIGFEKGKEHYKLAKERILAHRRSLKETAACL